MSNLDTLNNDRGSAHRRRAADPAIVHDNWLLAKSVVFCGVATVIVATVGIVAESFLL